MARTPISGAHHRLPSLSTGTPHTGYAHPTMSFGMARGSPGGPLQPSAWNNTTLLRSAMGREGVTPPCFSSQLGHGAEVGAGRHVDMQRDTQAAHWRFHWRDRSCCLSVTLFAGSAGRLRGLRNSTRYPSVIVLQGKRWSHCEHAVLLPMPSSSWILPRRAVTSPITPPAARRR